MQEEVQQIQWRQPASEPGPWRVQVNDFISTHNLLVTEELLVYFAPDDTAADHTHAQHEILLAHSGDLTLIWRDQEGVRHEEKMLSDNGDLRAFVIAPHVPHLIKNNSPTKTALMQVWNGVIDDPIVLTGQNSLAI
jgi:uncharacterized RmlC-like cupin family protein